MCFPLLSLVPDWLLVDRCSLLTALALLRQPLDDTVLDRLRRPLYNFHSLLVLDESPLDILTLSVSLVPELPLLMDVSLKRRCLLATCFFPLQELDSAILDLAFLFP